MPIFKKCCEECTPISPLPAITIDGMTGEGWIEIGGGIDDCCYSQTFTYDEEQELLSTYSDDLYDKIIDKSITSQVLGQIPLIRPFYAESSPPPDPITDPDYCCYEFEIMGTIVYSQRQRYRSRVAVKYRMESLVVTISKQTLACLSDPAALKWIVTLSAVFDWEIWQQYQYRNNEYETYTPAGSCFELSPGVSSPTTIEDVGLEGWTPGGAGFSEAQPLPGSAVSSGQSTLHKAKWFDTLPATITFGDSSQPISACPTTCNQLNQLYDSFCFEFNQLFETAITPTPLDSTCYLNEVTEVPYTLQDIPIGLCTACPTPTIAVDIYPDTPPAPPEDCLTVGEIVDVDVDCDCPQYRYNPLFPGPRTVFQTKDSCATTVTDPCGIETDVKTQPVLTIYTAWDTSELQAVCVEDLPREACVDPPDITLEVA